MISPRINFLGMAEPGLYVCSNEVFHTNRACNLHVHGIAWGCSPQQLQTFCERIRKDVWCSVPYLSPAKWAVIEEATWLKFSGTAPNSQTSSINCGGENGGQAVQAPINEVNAVCLYHQMSYIRLDELTFGRGLGDNAIARASRSYVRQAKKRRLP